MGLESGTFISDLNPANPAPGDNKAEGDDHIRLTKRVLKNTFPNVTKAITRTADQLNADPVLKNSNYVQFQGPQPMIEFHVPGKTAMIQYLHPDGRMFWAISNGSAQGVQNLYSVTGAWMDVYVNLNVQGGSIYSSHMRLTAAGAVSVTMAIPGYSDRILHRNVDAMGFLGLDGNWNMYSHNNGDLWARGNVSAFSDERTKQDWVNPDPQTLERFAAIKLVGMYSDKVSGARRVGVGAQSLMKVLPAAVTQNEGLLGVNYGGAAMVLVHELTKRLLALEAEVRELRGAA